MKRERSVRKHRQGWDACISFTDPNVRKKLEQNDKFSEELIAYVPLIRHRSQRIRCLEQFFVAAGTSLPSRCLATMGGIRIQIHGLMGWIYEVRRWDGLRCHVIHTKFHKQWFRHSNVDSGGGGVAHTNKTHRQQDDLISLIYFFQNEESRIKRTKHVNPFFLPKIVIFIRAEYFRAISENIPKLPRKSVSKFFGCPLLKEIQAVPMGVDCRLWHSTDLHGDTKTLSFFWV
jgi:hypothetical protein